MSCKYFAQLAHCDSKSSRGGEVLPRLPLVLSFPQMSRQSLDKWISHWLWGSGGEQGEWEGMPGLSLLRAWPMHGHVCQRAPASAYWTAVSRALQWHPIEIAGQWWKTSGFLIRQETIHFPTDTQKHWAPKWEPPKEISPSKLECQNCQLCTSL